MSILCSSHGTRPIESFCEDSGTVHQSQQVVLWSVAVPLVPTIHPIGWLALIRN